MSEPTPADARSEPPDARGEPPGSPRGQQGWRGVRARLLARLAPAEQLLLSIPGAKRALRCAQLLVRGFHGETISLRASALTYLTLFALVPLLAVVYAVLELAGNEESLRSSVQAWLTDQLGIGAGAVLESRLAELTSKANVKTLGAIGFAFLLGSIVSLLWNIESAFNHIYAVKRPRKLLERLLKYWSFLTLGPLLLAGSLGLTWRISALQTLHSAHAQAGHSEILHALTALSSIAITYAALTLLYKVMPNARVPLRSAFGAAFVAGTLWELAKFLFAIASERMVQVHKIYGSLAVLPILLTWVYISWVITLGGCRLCFAFEASRKPPEHPFLRGAAAREALTARLAIELVRLYRVRNRPVRARWISQELSIPQRLVVECLRSLRDAGLVAETRERRFLPARDPASISLAQLRQAARRTMGFPQLEADALALPLSRALGEAEDAASAQLGESIDAFLARNPSARDRGPAAAATAAEPDLPALPSAPRPSRA